MFNLLFNDRDVQKGLVCAKRTSVWTELTNAVGPCRFLKYECWRESWVFAAHILRTSWNWKFPSSSVTTKERPTKAQRWPLPVNKKNLGLLIIRLNSLNLRIIRLSWTIQKLRSFQVSAGWIPTSDPALTTKKPLSSDYFVLCSAKRSNHGASKGFFSRHLTLIELHDFEFTLSNALHFRAWCW